MIFSPLPFFWSFIKEIFLGKLTVREAVRKHKWRVFFVFMFMGSVTLNTIVIPKIFTITFDYVQLRHKYEALQQTNSMLKPNDPEHKVVETKPRPIDPTSTHPEQIITQPTSNTASQDYNNAASVFSDIEAREHTAK